MTEQAETISPAAASVVAVRFIASADQAFDPSSNQYGRSLARFEQPSMRGKTRVHPIGGGRGGGLVVQDRNSPFPWKPAAIAAAGHRAPGDSGTCSRRSTVYHHRMDTFANFDENFALELIAVLVLMAIWTCAIVAIDRWVWTGRSDVPHRGFGGRGIAPQDGES